ncbi:MAG: alkaline phosphatase family protein [Myxococcales bacterium]
MIAVREETPLHRRPALARPLAALAAFAVACSPGLNQPSTHTRQSNPPQDPPQTPPSADPDAGDPGDAGDAGTVGVGDPPPPPDIDAGTPIDPPPPVATATLSLASGSVVASSIVLAATVPDGTSHVDFKLDGALLGTASAAPFTTTWNTYSAGNGAHTLLADAVAAGGAITASSPVQVTVANHVNHVFVILMENHNWSSIKGSPSAPYINGTLLKDGAHAEKYMNVPGLHPSLPNYLWLESGSNQGVWDDKDPSSHLLTAAHLTQLLSAAGVSWKAYEEDIDGHSCPLTGVDLYAPRHDPAVYFKDVNGGLDWQSAECIAHIRPYGELVSDLEKGSVPQYSFITPNTCDDMHDSSGCATTNSIKNGDTWLSQAVPQIVGSAAYRNGGALFITWDESEGSDVPIGFIALSPLIKPGYSSTVAYTHSSTLRSIEEIFGLTPLLGDAANATNLSDLFKSFP